ncbi:transglutaminase-like cysteine peptidase [Microvirga arabica]|uniref:transglutaminase-like cysteine peptidase n=1 Tax=Microvirga arabica TaxID=1128671 RepID=UPI00248391BF|nr:transglutaminase-like cysteine peptidase [Microvirga arabica]
MEFCARQPQECIIDASEPEVLSLNQEFWLTIVEVNERVNRTILVVTDQDHWSELDCWDYRMMGWATARTSSCSSVGF